MAFKKGQSGNPTGRPAGAKDKAQSEIKEAFQLLVEGNLLNIEIWLKKIAARDPAKALDLILKLAEFVLPKMKATEITSSIDLFPAPRTLTKDEAKEYLLKLERYC